MEQLAFSVLSCEVALHGGAPVLSRFPKWKAEVPPIELLWRRRGQHSQFGRAARVFSKLRRGSVDQMAATFANSPSTPPPSLVDAIAAASCTLLCISSRETSIAAARPSASSCTSDAPVWAACSN